jgi:hypothetical protein
MTEEHGVPTLREYEAPTIREIGSFSDLTQGHHPHQHHPGCGFYESNGHGTGAHWCHDPSDPSDPGLS